jgi:F-type H+-transporting ATPase subunit epsilon
MTTFQINIRTPEETLYEGEINKLSLTTDQGELQIMANHAALTGTISFCPVKLEDEKGKEDTFLIRNGLVLFNNKNNSATILALYGERRSEITHQTAKEYLKFIKKQLSEGHDMSEFQILYLEGEKLAVEHQLDMHTH